MSAPSGTPVVDDVAALADLLRPGGVLVLTGAGISTESGIPDYRDARGRLRNALPMTFDRFTADAEARRRYWARSHVGWPRVATARPNAGHGAVADLERRGLLTGVITQNVDGLHQRAGTREVVDLHGRLDRVTCLGCGRVRPRVEVGLRLDVLNPGFRASGRWGPTPDRPDGDVLLDEAAVAGFRVADCRACGGILKPDVVFFGERVPRERFVDALGRLERSRVLLVLGSSLAVGSGYRMATAARRAGLAIAIATRGSTRADHLADLRVDARLGPLLSAVVGAV